MTTAVAPDAATQPKYPEPLVSFKEDRRRWTRNHVQQLLTSIPLAHVMVLAWIAVYYIVFELIHPVKRFWDTLLSQHIQLLSQANWNTWRHMFRGGGESYLATMVVLFVLFNPYKHPKSMHRIESAAAIVGRALLTLVLMIPLFIGLGLLAHYAQRWLKTGALAPDIGSHPNIAAKLYSDEWTTKVVVVLAGFLGRRPMFPVFAFVLEYFAERRVARGGTDHWWEPAPYRAIVRELSKHGATEIQRRQAERSRSLTWLMLGGVVVIAALAAYGVYILEHYAK
ncbi:MAG TPA: hypothetical protein VG410_01960 [Solirubrobacteraceae bacterium]|jgi:hypothetical protein|nr:hypothetical protein [Solirubrobacteraceae bacterium]